ncbi:MAG: cobalamin biosynthesis protein CbiG [Desulfotalea sp.]|nr:MAG: cobalamin biosynthesis protein CbiG [Desulfotalea sp.]
MKIGVIAVTEGGHKLAATLVEQLSTATLLSRDKDEKIAECIARNWQQLDGLVCIMATGIVVRSIAPLIVDKQVDPCVIVCDQLGAHVISLLSGHLGGGNALATEIADITGGQAVITTASDTLGLIALDLWAKEKDLTPPAKDVLTRITTQLVNKGSLLVFSDVAVTSLPKGLKRTDNLAEAEIIVSHKRYSPPGPVPFYPKNLVVGVGCNRGTGLNEFEEALAELFSDLQLSHASIRNLASIDKKNDEVGLLQFAEKNCWTIDFFDNTTINSQNNLEISFAALKAVGAIGVAEPTSLLSANSNLLISRKRKWKNVTMAIAQVPFTL